MTKAHETIRARRLAEGRAQQAAEEAHEALEQAQTGILAAAQHRWTAELAFGRALRQLGQTNDAIAALQAAVSDIEGERGSVTEDAAAEVRYFKDKVEAYTELVDLLVSKGRNRAAFAVAEQMRD